MNACWNSSVVGHSRQNVFSPLRGKGIAAAFTGGLGTFHSVLAENKALHRRKIFKSAIAVFSTQFEIITSWSEAKNNQNQPQTPGSSSVSMPGDPEAPRCLEMDLQMGIAKS